MDLNKRQKEYVINDLKTNRGSETTVMKKDIIKLATGLGLEFKKNIGKESLIDLIIENNEERFFDEFAKHVSVSQYYVATTYRVSYKQLIDLEELGVIEKLPWTTNKGYVLYPLSILKYELDELKEIWENNYKKDFHRVRIEIGKESELEDIMKAFENNFEIQSKKTAIYEQREGNGYYAYLSMRIKK